MIEDQAAAIPLHLLERVINYLRDYPSPTGMRLEADVRAFTRTISPPADAKGK